MQNVSNCVPLKKPSKAESKQVTSLKDAYRLKLSPSVALTHLHSVLCARLVFAIHAQGNVPTRWFNCDKIISWAAFITSLVFKLIEKSPNKNAFCISSLVWKMPNSCVTVKCTVTRSSPHQNFCDLHYSISS